MDKYSILHDLQNVYEDITDLDQENELEELMIPSYNTETVYPPLRQRNYEYRSIRLSDYR